MLVRLVEPGPLFLASLCLSGQYWLTPLYCRQSSISAAGSKLTACFKTRAPNYTETHMMYQITCNAYSTYAPHFSPSDSHPELYMYICEVDSTTSSQARHYLSPHQMPIASKAYSAQSSIRPGVTMSYVRIAKVELKKLAEQDFAYRDGTRPGRFRFLDCKRYIDEQLVCIQEFTGLPKSQYAATSYVWRGLKAQQKYACAVPFSAKGAEDADPMSFSLLHTAPVAHRLCCCTALQMPLAMARSPVHHPDQPRRYKTWQISNMFDVYQQCKVCLVLPGGLAGLARLTEETPWIHRAWTLQESLAPPSVQVLYEWPCGSCFLQSTRPIKVLEVESQKAAATSLDMLIAACMVSSTVESGHPANPGPRSRSTVSDNSRLALVSQGQDPGEKAFWSEEEWSDHVTSLLRRPSKLTPRILSNRNKAGRLHCLNKLLAALTQDSSEGRANAIWRSALLQTLSRPVDMVFSIMDLLGAHLDPASFSPAERHNATVRLAKQLLQRGCRAEWLGAIPSARIPAGLGTTPIMPQRVLKDELTWKLSKAVERYPA
ncbi:hypothetical protein C7974DRAFT_451867 [Boeremia exigua]|uniref:uncharacterized protein n=1 Tax=Boeremia exigua TaxID=749465 RepID=UPI001E8E6BCE|nr:uncharacterized protein C7974DRAFT_451867 [Boeremia exigua]KAH6638471.1 hypothetical protein C7974DRAFT_451867 [Boeremia exigua]